MPYPEQPLNITGGCDCGAIRWRLDVPALADRPDHPFHPSGDGTARSMPKNVLCHCGFCRGGTSSLHPEYINAPAHAGTISALSPSAGDVADAVARGVGRLIFGEGGKHERPPFAPAADVLCPGAGGAKDTCVRFYRATGPEPSSARSFCGRCGSSIGYFFKLQPEWGFTMPAGGWTDVVDLNLATTDKEWLEKEWMRPDAQINTDSAIPWLRQIANAFGGDMYHDMIMGESFRAN